MPVTIEGLPWSMESLLGAVDGRDVGPEELVFAELGDVPLIFPNAPTIAYSADLAPLLVGRVLGRARGGG